MGLTMDIGSEFHLEINVNEKRNDNISWNFKHMIYTTSGRGALALLLYKINPKIKKVLLPNYLCDSIIQVFKKYGYECKFYEINRDLTPNISSINIDNVGVFFHMGYFGVQTNGSLHDLLEDIKEKSIIVVEDITQTLFSSYSRCRYNDYYIGSIRKWIGIPSGGLLASNEYEVHSNLQKEDVYSSIRRDALCLKNLYLNNKEESIKIKYRKLLAIGEKMLEDNPMAYEIDDESLTILQQWDTVSMIEKRRNNFITLHKSLQRVTNLVPVYSHIGRDVCPLFYPIYLNNRDSIQIFLSQNKIYCPVHWPVPLEVKNNMPIETKEIYDTILSIPCDQRYNANDMNRVADTLILYRK